MPRKKSFDVDVSGPEGCEGGGAVQLKLIRRDNKAPSFIVQATIGCVGFDTEPFSVFSEPVSSNPEEQQGTIAMAYLSASRDLVRRCATCPAHPDYVPPDEPPVDQ